MILDFLQSIVVLIQNICFKFPICLCEEPGKSCVTYSYDLTFDHGGLRCYFNLKIVVYAVYAAI